MAHVRKACRASSRIYVTSPPFSPLCSEKCDDYNVTDQLTSPEELCATQLETVPEYSEELLTALTPTEGVSKPKRKFGLPSYLLQPKVVSPLEDPNTSQSVSLELEEERRMSPLTPPTNRKGNRERILETFRPRSKSDVTYKSKRPSFLNQLKRKNVRNYTIILYLTEPSQYSRTAMLLPPPIEDP